MKRDKDWIDAMRSSLRETETPPPVGGWERLVHEMPRRLHSSGFGRYWPKIVSIAAAVLICAAIGGTFYRAHYVVKQPVNEVVKLRVNGEPKPSVDPSVEITEDETLAALVAAECRRVVAAPAEKGSVAVQPALTSSEHPDEHVAAELLPDSVAGMQCEAESVVERPERVATNEHSAREASFEPRRFEAPKLRRGKVSFGVVTGGALAFSDQRGVRTTRVLLNETPSQSNEIGFMKYAYPECSYDHKQPLSFGITAGKVFAHGLSLESGVTYTLLRSDVAVRYGSEDIRQTLHFIGIPVRLNWHFLNRGGFSLYMGAGGMVEKCVDARFGGESVREDALQWSAFGAVGAQYLLGSHVGIYFEPEVSYYFTQTKLRTVRTDSPLSLNLQLGIRILY